MDGGYQRFKETILMELGVYFPSGGPFEISTDKVEKKSHTMDALIIKRKQESVSPVFYFEQLYQNYLDGRSVQDICEDLTRFLFAHKIPELSRRNMSDYAEAKKSLRVRLIDKEANQKYLGQGPYRFMTLGAAVVYVSLQNSPAKIMETRVTHEMLSQYGVTDDQLFEDAMIQTRMECPFTFSSLDSVLRKVTGEDPKRTFGPGPELYVLTNREEWYGAAVALYPDTLQKVHRMVGEDFYILPSSVHELLVIRKSAVQDTNALRALVRSVNREEVRPEEQLSNEVFKYRGKERQIVQCKEKDREWER